MAAAGDKDRAFLLEPGGRILGVAPREDPVSRVPDDERRRREGSKFLQQHLALPSGEGMGAQGRQRGLEEARGPGQPVLLGQPRARGRPGAREEERRSSPGPLSDAEGRLAQRYRRLAVARQGEEREGGGDLPPETGAADEAESANACRIGERQAEGDQAAEGVSDDRGALDAKGVEEGGEERSEESRRAAGREAVGDPGQVRRVHAVAARERGL